MNHVDTKPVCLTACHQAGVSYMHPVTLSSVWDTNRATCAVMGMTADLGATSGWDLNPCDSKGAVGETVFPDPLVLLLSMPFDPVIFLHDVYGIHNPPSLLEWTLEYGGPDLTLYRVHSSFWKAAVTSSASIDDTLMNWYYEFYGLGPDYTYDRFYKFMDQWISETRSTWHFSSDLISQFGDAVAEDAEKK